MAAKVRYRIRSPISAKVPAVLKTSGRAKVKAGLGDNKPNLGKGPGGAQDKRSGQQAALEGKKPDLNNGPQKARPGGNAFDPSDGAKAGDYAKRGQASLGDRGAGQSADPQEEVGMRGQRRWWTAQGWWRRWLVAGVAAAGTAAAVVVAVVAGARRHG